MSKDPYSPDNYRGIILQSTLIKIFSHIINRRIGTYLESNNLLVEEQCGFRPPRSCPDHLFTISTLVEACVKQGLDTFVCFVDFKKVFDSISRKYLWEKMRNLGVSGKLLKTIQAMYTNVRYTIKVNELFTDYFKVDQGVKQGCPLSPTLFNIFINDLVLDLRKAGVGLSLETDNVCSLLYADDVALCAKSEKRSTDPLRCTPFLV